MKVNYEMSYGNPAYQFGVVNLVLDIIARYIPDSISSFELTDSGMRFTIYKNDEPFYQEELSYSEPRRFIEGLIEDSIKLRFGITESFPGMSKIIEGRVADELAEYQRLKAKFEGKWFG